MHRFTILFSLLALPACCAFAQFAPQVGIPGCDAIPKGSSQIKGWAAQCTVQRGWLDIAKPSLGYTSIGDSSMATGPADNAIVSLGDSGVATLTFTSAIYNGPGPDFAVFEYGFQNPVNPAEAFMELAFVEISSDGEHFFRFPSISYTSQSSQVPGAGVYMLASQVYNLAGKYISGYGTPFDLDNFAGYIGLDIDNIRYIRIVDVIGDIGAHGSKDNNGRKINDPYPTDFPTGGFDLDAVGVIHQKGTGIAEKDNQYIVNIYPNPTSDYLYVKTKAAIGTESQAVIADMTGKVLLQASFENETVIATSALPQGIYCIIVSDVNGTKWMQKISKL